MKVSIIIPTYNRGELIGETIESIIDQSYSDWELIIIDDGSSDETEKIIEGYIKNDKRINYYERPSSLTKGANSCRNYGFIKAIGQLIKWVDSDDLLVPESLTYQVNCFLRYSNIKLCLGYGSIFSENNILIEGKWSKNDSSIDYFSDHIRNNIRWPIGALMWKKWVFEGLPFHNNLKNSQEWLLHSRLLLTLNSQEIFNSKDIVYLVRKGHFRLSSSTSPNYFFHQAKARFFLIIEMIKVGHFNASNYFEISKQILIYFYYSLAGNLKNVLK